MKWVTSGVVVLVAAGWTGGCGYGGDPGTQVAEADFAFVNVNVIPMDREGALEAQTVLVRDGVIAAVGPAGDVSVPDGTETIAGAGHYLMPGLAEMHAHVPPQADPPREVLEEIMFLYIANGITTIRGMLGAPYQIDLADELERGELIGPTLYVAAPALNGNTAPDPETAESLVRAHQEAGYDLLKIHPGIPLDAWDRLTETAQEVAISFAGHVPADVGILHALETGHSCVDHLDGYVEALIPEELTARLSAGERVSAEEFEEAITDDAIQELVQATLTHGTYVVPTMYLWDNFYNGHDPDEVIRLPEMQYVSTQQREAWANQARSRPETPTVLRHTILQTRRRVLRALDDAGAGILMGTDSPQMYNVPGFALHREIRIYEEAGMSRQAVLASGTRTVARYVDEVLGLDGAFGTVAVGQRADLVLLGANPLDDLSNLENRAGVMVRGHWVSADEIEAGLAELSAKYAGS